MKNMTKINPKGGEKLKMETKTEKKQEKMPNRVKVVGSNPAGPTNRQELA
jgi:hypothetical protein